MPAVADPITTSATPPTMTCRAFTTMPAAEAPRAVVYGCRVRSLGGERAEQVARELRCLAGIAWTAQGSGICQTDYRVAEQAENRRLDRCRLAVRSLCGADRGP